MKIRIKDKIYENDCRDFNYYDDLVKLQRLMEDLGFPKIDLNDLKEMWERISDLYYASWLYVPSDTESLASYLSEIEVK